MVVHEGLAQLSQDEVDRIFHALADATRRDIVARVLDKPHSVSQLADQYAMSFAAVQKHVAVLERAGLVAKERRGREQLVRGSRETVAGVRSLLEEYEQIWRQRAAVMEAILAEDDPSDPGKDSRT